MNHTNFVRALAYLAGAAPVLQHLLPGLVPPPYGTVAAAVLGIGITAGHQVYQAIKGDPNAVTKASAFALALLAIPFLLCVGGCAGTPAAATVSKVDAAITSPQAQPYIQAAALAAVATAQSKGVSIAQINTIAKAAQVAAGSTTATLATIANAANREIVKLNLPPADLDAAIILEAALNAALQQQIGTNPTVAQTQAAVITLLSAVVTASGG